MSLIYSRLACAYKQAPHLFFLANRYEAIPSYGGCFAVSDYFVPPRVLSQVGKRELARIKAILGRHGDVTHCHNEVQP